MKRKAAKDLTPKVDRVWMPDRRSFSTEMMPITSKYRRLYPATVIGLGLLTNGRFTVHTVSGTVEVLPDFEFFLVDKNESTLNNARVLHPGKSQKVRGLSIE